MGLLEKYTIHFTIVQACTMVAAGMLTFRSCAIELGIPKKEGPLREMRKSFIEVYLVGSLF